MTTPAKEQNLANHARYVPGFHFVTGALAIVILGWSLYRLVTQRSTDALFTTLIALAIVGEFWYLRAFPLAVQDRLICLEEKLRLATLSPSESRSLYGQLTPNQLIALRFASDAEMPALAKRVIDEKITGRAAVKALIVNWRADHMRA
jgi:hypothetical protein